MKRCVSIIIIIIIIILQIGSMSDISDSPTTVTVLCFQIPYTLTLQIKSSCLTYLTIPELTALGFCPRCCQRGETGYVLPERRPSPLSDCT